MNQIHIKFGTNERLVVLKGVLWGTSQAEINSTDTSGNSFGDACLNSFANLVVIWPQSLR